ncbi:MAG: hypothetical protein ACKVWR_03760 [Acidimicrobiales bacterium]
MTRAVRLAAAALLAACVAPLAAPAGAAPAVTAPVMRFGVACGRTATCQVRADRELSGYLVRLSDAVGFDAALETVCADYAPRGLGSICLQLQAPHWRNQLEAARPKVDPERAVFGYQYSRTRGVVTGVTLR